jgi:protein subunit release factor A
MIPPEDLEIAAHNPRPPGGQHVGAGPVGVRVTHLPTGITAIVDWERSQHRNKLIAIDMIEAALTSPHFR